MKNRYYTLIYKKNPKNGKNFFFCNLADMDPWTGTPGYRIFPTRERAREFIKTYDMQRYITVAKFGIERC